MKIRKHYVLGLIPARGGSKSIPLKNMISLQGRPLISYVIESAKQCPDLDALMCSTDHEIIAQFCEKAGVAVIPRSSHLAEDDTPVSDVMIHVLEEHCSKHGFAPGMVALLQPTSPFVLPEHISILIRLMKEHLEADSAQTITTLPHNYHALNQRIVKENRVRFCFQEEREKCYNKQTKPTHYIFGNLVVSRAQSLLNGKGPFGVDSLYHKIEPIYAVDIDGPDDVDCAEYLLKAGKVILDSVS